jgi:5'-3' exonuclease
MDKILLIDGHNQMWRANTTFGPPIQHESKGDKCACKSPWDIQDNFCYGERYGLVFNFFRNLRPLIEAFEPNKCFFVLEGHPQFRYDLFPDYKANRIVKQGSSSKKEVLYKFEIIINLLQYLPITLVRASNYECDDVIATLAENLKDEDVTILSNDSDYIQLLQKSFKKLTIYNPIKKVDMESPTYPYVAWKCLAGDKSDNIPSLLTPKKVMKCMEDPIAFEAFLSTEENRANFNINRQLIEFRSVPEDEISLVEGITNFAALKLEFSKMKFESIVNDKSWEKFTNSFNSIKF